MKLRTLLLGFVFGSLFFPLLSCSQKHDAEEKYFLITTNNKIPYWQNAGAGFSQAGQLLVVPTVFSGPDRYDPQAQRQAFQEAIQKKATGILVSVADPNVMNDEIDQAIQQGVPVITLDSDAPSSKRLFFIGTNNYQAGFMGGQRLAHDLKNKGNVVAFSIPAQANLNERLRGYQDALASSPGIKIVRVVDVHGDPIVAFDTTTQILGGDKKQRIDGFVCLEALACKEVATVLSNNGIKDRVVIAMDTDADTLDWIRKGTISATISQKPYTMAYVGLKMLDDLHHHKLEKLNYDWARDSFAPIPAFVDTGSAVVDNSNLEAFVAATKSAVKK